MTNKQRLLARLSRHAWIVAMAVTVTALPWNVSANLVAQANRTAGDVTYTTDADGTITMTFGGQSPDAIPQFTRAAVAADQGVANSPFHGNYLAAQIETVSFQLRADTVPESARLVLRGGPRTRLWSRPLDIVPGEGEWVTYTIPMTLDSGWTRNDTDLATKWDQDLADVVLIGLEIQRGGFEAQAYSIATFVLNDPSGPSAAATLSAFEMALWERFGVVQIDALSDAQRRMDSLGDGMADWERILAEHDAEFARNLFKVRIVDIADDGVTIEWVGVRGSTYTLLRMDMNDVASGLVELPGGLGVDLPVETTGRMQFKDTTAVDGVNYAYAVRRNTSVTGD